MMIDTLKEYFLDNKYTRWYFSIIAKAMKRKSIDIFETHHIFPRCLFPNFSNLQEYTWNGVKLTLKEHFVCHLLLTKMTAEAIRILGITYEKLQKRLNQGIQNV